MLYDYILTRKQYGALWSRLGQVDLSAKRRICCAEEAISWIWLCTTGESAAMLSVLFEVSNVKMKQDLLANEQTCHTHASANAHAHNADFFALSFQFG